MAVTFGDLIPLLEDQIQILGQAPWRLSFYETLDVLQRANTQDADLAAISFAATRSWPPLEERTRMELCARLAAARLACVTRMSQPIRDPAGDLRSTLQWLLTDLWKDGWRDDWLSWFFFDLAIYEDEEDS